MAKKITKSKYEKTYNSFAGTDIVAVITPSSGKSITLGELQTISYSVFRSTSPVFALGRINAKGVVRGARTIAGSLIFTVFDRHVLYQVMQEYDDINKSDEIPAFDVTINFMNEYGESSQLTLYGVHLMSEGQTMSVEDMITENTMEFIAMDIDTMTPDVHEDN